MECLGGFMRISISENKRKNCISISFYKIDYDVILKIINFLKIHKISVFIDEFEKYKYYKTIETCDFVENISGLNKSVLIFDGEIEKCETDHEMEILYESRILIGMDLGERHTIIMINTLNNNVSAVNIRKILKN